jgi:cell division protein FtsQ
MKKKEKILFWTEKKLNILTVIILLFLFVFCVSFAETHSRMETCKGVKINIIHDNSNAFITENDVLDIINGVEDGPMANRKIHAIGFFNAEEAINHNQFVENAEVYPDLNGWVYIDLYQRIPVLRVLSNNNKTYYIDRNGKRMPNSYKYTTKILVASGFIENSNPLLGVDKQLYDMALYINKDVFLSALIGQIYVKKDTEMLLVPNIGDFMIDFGNASNLENKFMKLKVLYMKILPFEGWNKYNNVILKYKNQIIVNKK